MTEETDDDVTCSTYTFEHRGPARFVSIFTIESAVSGLGISYPPLTEEGEEVLIKLGRASQDAVRVDLNEEYIIRGLYGASSSEEITQLGLVIENIECSDLEAKKWEEAQRLSLIVEENGGSDAVIIVVIVLLVILALVAIALGVFWFIRRRNAKRSQVQFLP